MSRHIFLSPHLDDAVYSCGGIIHSLVQEENNVEIWTVFTGDPPVGELTPFANSLHQRWGEENPYQTRREEDLDACARLGVKAVHVGFLDCIYRIIPKTDLALISTDDDLFLPVHPEESYLIQLTQNFLEKNLTQEDVLYCPLAVGGHVDHRITRVSAERSGRLRFYYPDFPYASYPGNPIADQVPDHVLPHQIPLSSQNLEAWKAGVAAYHSQISSFWSSLEEMRQKIEQYAKSDLAFTLWQIS